MFAVLASVIVTVFATIFVIGEYGSAAFWMHVYEDRTLGWYTLEKSVGVQWTANVGRTEEMVADINRLVVKYRTEEKQLKRENQIYRKSIISISHDIRTPLTSAKGYLQMLQKGSVPQEKELEYIQIIEQRLDHVAELCYFLIQS